MLPWWGNRSFDFWFFWSDKYNTVILCFKVFFTPFWCYFTHFQRALQLFIQFELIWFDIALFFRKIWILQKIGQILSKADQYWIQTSWNYFWFEGIIDIAIKTAREIIKNGKYRIKNWVNYSFHDKIQFKGLFNVVFSGIFNSKNYSIIFFPRKFNSKIHSKFLIWLDSIQ